MLAGTDSRTCQTRVPKSPDTDSILGIMPLLLALRRNSVQNLSLFLLLILAKHWLK